MSVKVMTWVWEHSQSVGNERLVLLALADHADDERWEAWPDIARLALKTRLSERTVQRCIVSLSQRNELEVRRQQGGKATMDRRYRPNRYVIKGRQIVTPNEPKGRQIVTPNTDPGVTDQVSRGDRSGNPGVTLLSPSNTSTSNHQGTIRGASNAKSRSTAISDDFAVSDSMRDWATSRVPGIDVDREAEQFVNHAQANGRKLVNWEAGWRQWMLKALAFDQERAKRPAKADTNAAVRARVLEVAKAAGL